MIHATRTVPHPLVLALALSMTALPAMRVDAGGADASSAIDAYAKSGVETASNWYIIGFKAPPLALADRDGSGLQTLPRTQNGHLDVHAPAAVEYVDDLVQAQQAILRDAGSALGRTLAPQLSFQHAFNGVVLRLSGEEAVRIGSRPDVALVEPYHEYALDTDVGPQLIGAPGIWDGTATTGGIKTRGEGVVIGVIDSGANLGSPSFSATDLDGYTHVNPLGSGNYIGWCNPINPNHNAARDLCNDKLIGGWDFVDFVNTPTVTVYEAAGFEDNGGHGSHTASTAGGNRRNAVINGIPLVISGVAPRANLVIYDACYTEAAAARRGLCPNVSTVASINQAVADGIIDVINYSIGGGGEPWLEATSQAFLAAHNAGIYVAASAGNSGPGSNTLGHLEPWVSTTAASTHSRQFGAKFTLTAPGVPPANAQNIEVRMGALPWPALPTSGPLVVSPGFANGTTDGCSGYPAGTFAPGAVSGLAVLSLDADTSACGSGTRRANAIAAGAAGVIFVDDQFINLGASGTSWSMLAADWANIAAAISGDPANAAATITAAQALSSGQADVMADFSSRGPNRFTLLKPDLTAPGVSILAAYDRWDDSGAVPGVLITPPTADNNVAAISGTSMSSPHHAGSAALLRALNRSWTPTQIKTALVSTTTATNVFKEDGSTPSDPFDRGSGRIDLAAAVKAGLIMDESGANFSAADPDNGGDPSQLNLPSFQNLNCIGTCSFPRAVRGTRAQPVTWTASVSGLPVGAANVTPASFSASALSVTAFSLDIDSLQLPQDTTLFGELVLTPSIPSIPVSRMAIAVRRANPDIDVQPASISRLITDPASFSVPVTVSNLGNPSIVWQNDITGTATTSLLAQRGNLANGFTSGYFLAQAGGAAGAFYADDVNPGSDATVTRIRAEGFMTGSPTSSLDARAQLITFRIYNNGAGNVPAGDPDAGTAGELWKCDVATTNPGLEFRTAERSDNAIFELNLGTVTGCPAAPVLQAGNKYWFAVTPTINGTSAQRRWAWFRALEADTVGSPAQRIAPALFGITAWESIPAPADLALTVQGTVACGAPWLSLDLGGDTLGIGASSSATLTINPAGLAPGDHVGYVCFDTQGSDPDEAKVVLPVTLQVRAALLFTDGFESP